MLKGSPPGGHHFSGEPLILRKPALLTTSYVKCADYIPDGGNAGDVPIEFGSRGTFWADASFGSTPATSIDVKPVFCPMPLGKSNVIAGAHVGDNIYLGDLASTATTKVVTSATGAFEAWMVGQYLVLHSGTNAAIGQHLITGFTSATSITVATEPTSSGNLSSGEGGISCEFQECSQSTASGITTLSAHNFRMVAADFGVGADATDGVRAIWTTPLPAASIMRVYVRCNGTATASSLRLGFTLMPPEGA